MPFNPFPFFPFYGSCYFNFKRQKFSFYFQGIVVDCQIGRSQEGNKKEALRKLRAKLYELETDKQISNVTFQRKLQVR